eukprot:gene11777-2145_t
MVNSSSNLVTILAASAIPVACALATGLLALVARGIMNRVDSPSRHLETSDGDSGGYAASLPVPVAHDLPNLRPPDMGTVNDTVFNTEAVPTPSSALAGSGPQQPGVDIQPEAVPPEPLGAWSSLGSAAGLSIDEYPLSAKPSTYPARSLGRFQAGQVERQSGSSDESEDSPLSSSNSSSGSSGRDSSDSDAADLPPNAGRSISLAAFGTQCPMNQVPVPDPFSENETEGPTSFSMGTGMEFPDTPKTSTQHPTLGRVGLSAGTPLDVNASGNLGQIYKESSSHSLCIPGNSSADLRLVSGDWDPASSYAYSVNAGSVHGAPDEFDAGLSADHLPTPSYRHPFSLANSPSHWGRGNLPVLSRDPFAFAGAPEKADPAALGPS